MSAAGAPAAGGGGGCGGRVLRLLLLLVLALAVVEYMFGSYLDAGTGTLRAYLYTPPPPAALLPARTDRPGYLWPKRTQSRPTTSDSPVPDGGGDAASSPSGTARASAASATAADGVAPPNKTADGANTSAGSSSSAQANSSKIMSERSLTKVWRTKVKLKPCLSAPPDLGPIAVNKTEVSLASLENMYPEVQPGGRHSPAGCRALHKVAIIVPFRDRVQHLAIFLRHMHPMLMSQQLDYGIFIVEQAGKRAFNRAKLMNVGFLESQKSREGGWECFVFHDIDLLPLDARNIYSCPRQPRHMSVAIDKYKFKLQYRDIFGGVSAMSTEQFKAVNGFSNKYWGWGGEDDDMFYRLKRKNYHVGRYPMSVARYTMLEHKSQQPNPKRFELLAQTSKVLASDGISSVKYKIVKTIRARLYTNIVVDIDEPS